MARSQPARVADRPLMLKRSFSGALILLSGLFWLFPGTGAVSEPISASNFAGELPRALGPTYVITADEIQRLGIMTAVDALRLVPGVHVQLNEMKSKVTIRGTGDFPYTNRVLFLLDGVPINSPDTGTYPGFPMDHFLPTEEIDRIEITKGPASARWGPSAFWGVVNIITKRGAIRHGEGSGEMHEPGTAGKAETRYTCPMRCEGEEEYSQEGSCPICRMSLNPVESMDGPRMGMIHLMGTTEGEPMATATYGGQSGDLLYSVTGRFDVHKGGVEALEEEFEHRNNQTFFSLKYKNFDAMLAYLQDNSTPFTFRGGDNAGDEALFHEQGGQDMMEHPAREDLEFTTVGTRERVLSFFTGYEMDLAENVRVKSRLSYQHKTGTVCASCHTGTGTENPFAMQRVPWAGDREIIERGETVTERLFASSEVSFPFSQLRLLRRLTVGVDARSERVTKKERVVATLNNLDERSEVVGVFVQDDIAVLEERFWLRLGGRFDYLSELDNEVSWSAGVTAVPIQNLTMGLTARRAYNPPSWDQRNMALIIMSEIPALVMGSNEVGIDLRSEEIRSLDLNVAYTPHPKVSLNFDGYLSRVDDFIDRNGTPVSYQAVPPPMVFVWMNKSQTLDINGFELALSYRHSGRLRGSLAWAFQDTDTPAAPDSFVFGSWPYAGPPYAPRNKVYLKAFAKPTDRLDVSGTVAWVDRQWVQFHMYPSPAIYHNWADTDRVQGKPLASYMLVDLALGYRLPFRNNIHVGLRISDLLNEKPTEYRHHLQDPSNRTGREFLFMFGWMW